jgi:Ca2+-binding RTX toxin-like protein
VADAAYLSMDAQVRGLANVTGLSTDLLAKTKIEIPASVALTDADGSESLWVRITPVNASNTAIVTNGFDFTGITNTDNFSQTSESYLVKASELTSLRVASVTAFTGTFKVDAISVEGAPATAAAARTIIDAGVSNTFAVTSQNLAVEFLQPATTPTVSFGGMTPSLTTVSKTGGTEYDLTFKVNVTSGASDKVTVLMTGVPFTAGEKAKFYIIANGVEKLIGAPAEVSGVWVFNASEFIDSSVPATAYTVYMVLPSGYVNTSTVFDVTAFAVDSLGLTNAKSSVLTSPSLNLSIPVAALDPVIIDTAGDGLALTNATTRVAFDLNADGNIDQVGWVAGRDDAFLVLRRDANNDGILDAVTDGNSLATENLVAPVTTDAIADLRTFDNDKDGILTKAELLAHGRTPQLWFDNVTAASTANAVAAASELANVSDNFSINLAAFNDTATRDAGGALLAGSIAAGGITGTYTFPSGVAQSLSSARTFDVFLPVTTTTTIAQSTMTAFAKTEIEDALSGIDLSAALVGTDWQSQFGSAWTNGIAQGANVLLTIRAKEAGTTFNLSQGARLDGQATDTWLMLWKPQEAATLKLFAKDNFSGLMNFEMRATVVYTSGVTPVSYTVSRDLGLTVTPVSDRPDLVVPDSFASVAETALAGGQDIALSGLKLTARDGSETVSLVFAPTTALPSGSYFKYKGAVINADAATGKFTITGQVSASDVQLHVPAYASGTFGFNVTAMSRDGTATVSQIDNIPLTVRVTPVAQAPVVTLMAAQASVSETVREFAVTLQATPADPDGSEEVASVKLLVSNSILPTGSTFVVGTGVSAVTYAFASTTVAGQFELVLPKSALTAGTGLAKTLTGKIVTPAYFDGALNIQAAATTVEQADATLQATSNLVGTTVTITPVTNGLAAFDTKGLSVNAGEDIAFGKLVTALTKLDADESLTLTVSGIPAGATLYESSATYAVVGGVATITNASLAKLANFKLVTGTLQSDFVLTVTASSKDDAAATVDVVKSINIASSPLLEPVTVKSNGTALVGGNLSLSFNEGTSGILDVGVSVGSKLNPATATVTLSGVPTGIKVYSVASNTELSVSVVGATTNQFTFNATALSQGLRLVVPNTAAAALVDFSGKVNLSLSTSLMYGAVEKITVTPTSLVIQPVTDGLSFTASIARAEDQTWSVSDLLSKKDGSETLSSVTIAQNANLTVWVNSTQLSPANGPWVLTGSDIANAVMKPVANYHGPLSLGLTTVTQDFGTADTTASAAQTQNASVVVDLSAVADTPLVTGLAESQVQLFSSNARTNLLTEAVINDGRVDTGANLNLSIRLAAVTSTDPQETLTTVLTGSAIGSGVVLEFTSATGSTQSLSSTFVGGQWQISVPSTYTTTALDATLVIPKAAGYGARELTVTAKTVDGTSINSTVFDTDSFTILSTIPPQPVVGLLPEIKGSDLSTATTLGLKLTDLVRVPMLNESVVLELIGLTPGVQVKVNGAVLNTVSPALSTVDGAALTAIRLTAAQLETARVFLTADVVNGTTALSFSARSGSSDGYVANPATGSPTSEVRYVYSRLVDANVHLNASTSGDDHRVVQSATVDVGAGDDTVVVDGKGAGALSGGLGTDTLSLAGLQDGAMVDLNFGKMIALSADSAVQSGASAVRAVSGFEVLVGSAANDILVSNGESTVAMTLRGRGGEDILVGGAGNDLIEGGSGADELSGGAGVDTFVLVKGSGQDTVIDFNLTQDKIVLAGFGLNFGVGKSLPNSVRLTASTSGDWLVTVDDATSGVSGAQLLLKGSASASQQDILNSLSFNDTLDWANGDVRASDFQMPIDAQTLAVNALARELYLGDNYDFSDLGSMLSVIADARFEKALAVNLNTHIGTVNDLGDMAGYKGFAGTAYDDVLVGNDQSSVLLGGSGGSDILVGGGARDILVAGAKTLAAGVHITDELSGGGGADMFVFVNSESLNVDKTLNKIYEVNVTDFNREEGDRIVAVGYGDSVDAIKIDNVAANSNSQAVHFSDSLTVYFDLSFAREFDSNFSLRMADFDKI